MIDDSEKVIYNVELTADDPNEEEIKAHDRSLIFFV
jgi:hypothetical protein